MSSILGLTGRVIPCGLTPYRAVTLLSVCSLLAGCAVGNTHTFRYSRPAVDSVGNDRVVLMFKVREARAPIVVEGEPPTWVGEQRSGFGIPYNVLTTDRRPFYQVVSETIQKDLEAAGFSVVATSVQLPNGPVALGERLSAAEAERGLYVEMRKFNSNTYTNIDVEWDFIARVFAASGAQIAENHLEGRTTLPGSFLNPPAAAKQRVPPFFYQLMRELVIESDEVMMALSGEAESPDADIGKCTIEQILGMRDSGLSEAQIRAACAPPSPPP